MSGEAYNFCANLSGGATVCAQDTINGSTSLSLNYVPPTPSAPSNLTAPSPTNQSPALSWGSVTGATSYDIYQDDTVIGSSTTNSYTDTSSLTSGATYSYYVTAVNAGGESAASNTISVMYDTTPPTITDTVTPVADTNGYNTGKVLVTFTCADSVVTVSSCTSPVTVNNEGIGQTATGAATDLAGNTTTTTVNPSLLNQAVNAGGNASGNYNTDTGSNGGATFSTTPSVDTSNVINPAPQDVYQSARYGTNFSYTFSGLTPNARYTLLMQFNELYWGADASSDNGGIGSRVFNVSVNGTSALTNYDIYKEAGGANKAITEQVPATADTNGDVTVQFTAVTDNAMVNGLQLFNGTLPAQVPDGPTAPAVTSINAGGSASDSFGADTDYYSGTAYTSSADVDTSGVTNPAPESVYQSIRYGTNFTYTVPALTPNTNYLVRLHFNELYWGTVLASNQGGVGSRIFNVAINGDQVLNNFDVYATAGGANKAVVEEFEVPSDSNGNISINFTSDTDNAMVSGIEVDPVSD